MIGIARFALAFCVAFQAAYAEPIPDGSSAPGGGLVMTGQRLSEICDGKLGSDAPNTFQGGTCLGFINGVAEMWLFNGAICYNNVRMGELSDVVVKYMNEHPDEVRRHTAIVLIGVALKSTYPDTSPCREQIGRTR